jgi:hypothetical protein
MINHLIGVLSRCFEFLYFLSTAEAVGTAADDQTNIDPIIRGLLARLPKSGNIWPEAERKLWLDLLAGSFKLIYKDSTDGP